MQIFNPYNIVNFMVIPINGIIRISIFCNLTYIL